MLNKQNRKVLKMYRLLPIEVQRSYFRQNLFNKKKLSTFNKVDAKKVMQLRYDTLQNFMSKFGYYLLIFYKRSNIYNRYKLRKILGKDRFMFITYPFLNDKEKDNTKDHWITINEIIKLYMKLNLKKDFISYILSKTNLSYTIVEDHVISPVVEQHIVEDEEDGIKIKFNEFIHIIISKYILLHNLMFATGWKLKEIKSIDTFLKDI